MVPARVPQGGLETRGGSFWEDLGPDYEFEGAARKALSRRSRHNAKKDPASDWTRQSKSRRTEARRARRAEAARRGAAESAGRVAPARVPQPPTATQPALDLSGIGTPMKMDIANPIDDMLSRGASESAAKVRGYTGTPDAGWEYRPEFKQFPPYTARRYRGEYPEIGKGKAYDELMAHKVELTKPPSAEETMRQVMEDIVRKDPSKREAMEALKAKGLLPFIKK